MGLFSKLFGGSEPGPQPVVPDGASARDVIAIAVDAVINELGGNCATLECGSGPVKWVQVMAFTLNCHYPHAGDPKLLFPELLDEVPVIGIDAFDENLFLTVGLGDMEPKPVVDWIARYFTEVLAVDLASTRLTLRMEEM